MARRIVNRKDLRAAYDAAEARTKKEDEEEEDEEEEGEEGEDEEEEAESADDEEGDEDEGDDDEDAPVVKKKKKTAPPRSPSRSEPGPPRWCARRSSGECSTTPTSVAVFIQKETRGR